MPVASAKSLVMGGARHSWQPAAQANLLYWTETVGTAQALARIRRPYCYGRRGDCVRLASIVATAAAAGAGWCAASLFPAATGLSRLPLRVAAEDVGCGKELVDQGAAAFGAARGCGVRTDQDFDSRIARGAAILIDRHELPLSATDGANHPPGDVSAKRCLRLTCSRPGGADPPGLEQGCTRFSAF